MAACNNRVTIEGEKVTFKCSFGDNYSPVDYDVFWRPTLEDGSYIIVQDDMNYTDFHMYAYLDCPPNNYSCCQFTSELSVHTNLSINNAAITCVAIINELTTSSGCHLSELHVAIVHSTVVKY